MEENNNIQTKNEQAQVVNQVVEIVGSGSRDSACEHLRQILTGYSMYSAWLNNQGANERGLEDSLYNIEVLSDLLKFAMCDKMPNEK